MKKIISILLIFSMLACFTACGKKTGGKSGGDMTKVEEPTAEADASSEATDDNGQPAQITEKRTKGNVYDGTSKEEAEACIDYAQKYLDCLYHGKTDGVEDGESVYNDNLEEVNDLIFTNTFGAPEYVTEEQEARYAALTKQYIDKADYSFEIEENEDGTFSAVFNVNAIHLLADTKDAIMAYREQWHTRYDALTNEELNDRTEEQWAADYIESTDAILNILEENLAAVTENATPMSLYVILDDTSDSGLSMENNELNNYIVGVTQ